MGSRNLDELSPESDSEQFNTPTLFSKHGGFEQHVVCPSFCVVGFDLLRDANVQTMSDLISTHDAFWGILRLSPLHTYSYSSWKLRIYSLWQKFSSQAVSRSYSLLRHSSHGIRNGSSYLHNSMVNRFLNRIIYRYSNFQY